MTPERMKEIERLADGFRAKWVPETGFEHIVLAYDDDRDEYGEVFEACNDAVAQGIIEMRAAIPELLAAVRERCAQLNFIDREVLPNALNERHALESRIQSLEAQVDKDRASLLDEQRRANALGARCERLEKVRAAAEESVAATLEEIIPHVHEIEVLNTDQNGQPSDYTAHCRKVLAALDAALEAARGPA